MLKSRVAIPYVIWMAVFILAPILLVVYFAFTDKSGNPSLVHVADLMGYAPVFLRSIMLAAIATVICLIIAYPVSFTISRFPPRRQKLMLMMVMLPMWINFLLRTYAWMALLERNGIINSILGVFGIGPLEMIGTDGAIVLGMVYNYLPFMILPMYSTMVKIDNSIIQAAQDLGCGPINVFKNVLLPLSVPGITTGITLVFVPSISTFIISRMLGGGSNMLIGDVIELQFLGNSNNYGLGSAMALVLMLIVLACMSITNKLGDEESMEGMI